MGLKVYSEFLYYTECNLIKKIDFSKGSDIEGYCPTVYLSPKQTKYVLNEYDDISFAKDREHKGFLYLYGEYEYDEVECKGGCRYELSWYKDFHLTNEEIIEYYDGVLLSTFEDEEHIYVKHFLNAHPKLDDDCWGMVYILYKFGKKEYQKQICKNETMQELLQRKMKVDEVFLYIESACKDDGSDYRQRLYHMPYNVYCSDEKAYKPIWEDENEFTYAQNYYYDLEHMLLISGEVEE